MCLTIGASTGRSMKMRRERGAGAFLRTGVGWYRKHFTLPADAEKKHIFIDFDGVMANSDVWINGFHLGKRPYGYSSFRIRHDRARDFRR